MLRELKGFKLLEGVRGAKPADVDALVDTIMKVQRLALDLADDVARARHQPAGRAARVVRSPSMHWWSKQ